MMTELHCVREVDEEICDVNEEISDVNDEISDVKEEHQENLGSTPTPPGV